ncbi:PH domain-containing protein [Streptomyces johnsoniae]|uniref:PH domain-containing protein n=1 Tax=Streptomyces johnsoniae TaxID=3075532 RepID=A0ABU2S221_9ACTN|nr:PH domain-containing protein [Streptomyces sp. DSM 41886]MDT0442741.1 PH domain-containing protein [Streptomyces sp. DSM 41886]
MSAPAVRPPDLPVTFRPVLTRIVLLTTGGIVFGVLTLIAALLPAGGAVSWALGERLAVAASGLLIWGVLCLLSRPRLAADRDGVTVVNLTTKRRLAWAEIVRVTLRPGDPWVTLDLADGTVQPVMAIQPGVSRKRALADARALRSLAETFGTAHTTS